VVFQPYRVYRTRDLQAELAEGLALADQVIVMEVFGPGEVRGPGEGGVALTAAIDLPDAQKVFAPDWEDVPAEVLRRSRPGDVVVTMGAPPISLMGDELLAALANAPLLPMPGPSDGAEKQGPFGSEDDALDGAGANGR
jgi:UDP-N-acetylmuramate--alanine ligase